MRMILGRKKHRRFTVYALGRWILTPLMACTQRTRPDTTGHDRAIYFQISAIEASATPKKSLTQTDGCRETPEAVGTGLEAKQTVQYLRHKEASLESKTNKGHFAVPLFVTKPPANRSSRV
jgi:hypothetical protein